MLRFVQSRKAIAIVATALLILALLVPVSAVLADRPRTHTVNVPEEDRFDPFVMTIKVGDQVTWVNKDTDDHTIVSDDFFTNTSNRGINTLLPGTDSNGGKPGKVTLRFRKAGVFVYYCRFHSHLDDAHQPAAPGPDGGIQDANGNFGLPMSGIIVVLPGHN